MVKLIAGFTVIICMSGCVMKSKIVKQLEPVDIALQVLSTIDCSTVPDSRCQMAKEAAITGHNVLQQLGVNVTPPVPPTPAK